MTPLTYLPNPRKPRERLYEEGASALALDELLAVILRTGSQKQDVLSLARQVERYLLTSPPHLEGLASLEGVGRIKAAEILAALQIAEALRKSTDQRLLSRPQAIYENCQDLVASRQEHLVVFFLTSRQTQISRETISIGTASASLVHPREIFRPAISNNASCLVIAHNHPSGDPTPSQADLSVTCQLVRAGELIGIEVLDHVVCALNSYTSIRAFAPDIFLPSHMQLPDNLLG